MPGDDVFLEGKKGFVPFHGEMSLAIHDGDWSGVPVFVRIQPGYQLVERFEVRVVSGLPERIDDDGMNLALLRRAGSTLGCGRLGSWRSCPDFLHRPLWFCG